MTLESLKDLLASYPFSQETYPFDEITCVYKVGGKMFALINAHETNRLSINLKNSPENNILLRDMYQEIIEGYHMNKTHWNTVYLDGTLDDSVIKNMIDDSYHIVYKQLTKKIKLELENEA